jgi:hypothetical protein
VESNRAIRICTWHSGREEPKLVYSFPGVDTLTYRAYLEVRRRNSNGNDRMTDTGPVGADAEPLREPSKSPRLRTDDPFENRGDLLVADGTDAMRERIERVLTNDPGLGVVRHADAGYEEAMETLRRAVGVRHPMVE